MPNQKRRADALFWYLTGAGSDGGAQTDVDLSLGNFRSSTTVIFMAATITTPISNITIDFIGGKNGLGAGTLAAASASSLTWKAPGGSVGIAVTILNGETKIVEDLGDPAKYLRVSRTSASSLTGSATVTIADRFNGVTGFDNVTSVEAAAGDDEIRAIMVKNESTISVDLLKVFVKTLGTQLVSGSTQLPASGLGTIEIATGNFDTDWPDTGWCRIEDSSNVLQEIVYFSSRTNTVLTVPANGRARLGTSASAGSATDLIYPVPGIRIAKESPTAQAITDKTGSGEGSIPALTFNTGITAATGEDIGTLASGDLFGLWLRRDVPVGQVADASILNAFSFSFDTA